MDGQEKRVSASKLFALIAKDLEGHREAIARLQENHAILHATLKEFATMVNNHARMLEQLRELIEALKSPPTVN